jgi:hypothetical protein
MKTRQPDGHPDQAATHAIPEPPRIKRTVGQVQAKTNVHSAKWSEQKSTSLGALPAVEHHDYEYAGQSL